MNVVRIGCGGASVMTQAWLRTPRQTLLIEAFTEETSAVPHAYLGHPYLGDLIHERERRCCRALRDRPFARTGHPG